ncbi:Phytanoyl-CoA dioxygenase (PhyH) [Pedobacter steynii]|uniref:Phytanoyl-CoA dioxygenase (PhyH) n=1 Tax=Pedobacter steynii TaxID=430522 RepID=A0A1G9NQS9_9SPHI|nr:phytanoyl-CoA dioxygenase family protein [Pedobacter steynii]NQX39222.1 phytanoyl-CoA dioxygenase family protein [Pedobacter steynii]SDL88663.1 Phytanoyl-CoA dioxygenase (PhyH) [Pedobacter steynii]
MLDFDSGRCELEKNGFTTVDSVFSKEEIAEMLCVIEAADSSKSTFRKSADLFAIRQFLKEIPEINPIIFNQRFENLVQQFFGEGYFVVKSIYFDKPEQSNWFVAYHQDLTISVDKKEQLPGYGNWTVKQGQFAVQPPLEILEQMFTVRIHLDDTDENNGALKVISGSHLKGISRLAALDLSIEKETSCRVSSGGAMIMKPLLLHSSGRTINNSKRRVIHIEFSKQGLPAELNWAERNLS